jgi:predicted nucleic acid-binding protein
MPGSFIDTNVLLYLASNNAEKAERAESIVASGATISVQVLNEFANVARRKMQLTWDETHAFLDSLRGLLAVDPITIETHVDGLRLAERYKLSIYDSMILASAVQAKCDVVWSEDMQSGLQIDGAVTIRNPFLPEDKET